jgi:hypothetical protein
VARLGGRRARGHAIESGHFIPEEAPDATYEALRGFFADTELASNAV